MCNAKPGTRCGSDTYKPLFASLSNMSDRLNKHPELINSSRFVGTIADMEDKAIQFLAANSSRKNPEKAMVEYRALLQKLPVEVKNKLTDEKDLQRAAGYLHQMQTRADEFSKQRLSSGSSPSQRDVAYAMTKEYKKMNSDLLHKIEKDSSIEQSITPAGKKQIDAFNKAKSMADMDVEKILEKDMRENSQGWKSRLHPDETLRILRQRDGSFTVKNTFLVKSNDPDKALTIAEDAFKLEDVAVKLTPTPTKNEQLAEVTYSSLAKDLGAAHAFNRNVFKGSPHQQAVLADVERVAKMNNKR